MLLAFFAACAWIPQSGDDSAACPPAYADSDGDGAGDPYAPVVRGADCGLPSGAVENDDDCDDSSAERRPGGAETCDGQDQDCDGSIDEDAAELQPSWPDGDGDGFGDASQGPVQLCPGASGFVDNDADCDDGDAAVNPDAVDICDDVDDNCSGDESDAQDGEPWYADLDGDDYGDPDAMVSVCPGAEAPEGYQADDDDCDDARASVNPGESEVCEDGLDNDCSGGAPACRWNSGESAAFTFDDGQVRPTTAFFLGDLDGDGASELAILAGAWEHTAWTDFDLYLAASGGGDVTDENAAATWTPAASTDAARALAGAADFDRDGDLDLALGTYLVNGEAKGAVSLLPARTGGAVADAARLFGEAPDDRFGWSLAAGDLDADGGQDLVVSAPGADAVSEGEGRIYLFAEGVAEGAADEHASATWGGVDPSNGDGGGIYALSVALGDLDGDGLPDLVVGAPGTSSNDGAVHVIDASTLLLGGSLADADGVRTDSGGDRMGFWVATGDVDGDGKDDVLAGAPNIDEYSGSVFLFSGPMSGEGSTALDAAVKWVGDGDNGCGAAGAVIPDLDGDGKDEVALGFPETDTGGRLQKGQVGVWYGPAEGAAAATWTDPTDFPMMHMGENLAAGPDVTGDGIPDLFVGSRPSYNYDTQYGVNGRLFAGTGL